MTSLKGTVGSIKRDIEAGSAAAVTTKLLQMTGVPLRRSRRFKSS